MVDIVPNKEDNKSSAISHISMPTANEIQQRKSDERRVQAENTRAAAARKAVLRKHLAQLSQQKSDVDRQISETTKELSGLG